MEPTFESSGQRLRWWTTETATPQAAPYAESNNTTQTQTAPQTTAAPTDLWEELEAEAQRRALNEQNAVIVEGDTVTTFKKGQRRAVIVIAFFCLLSLGQWMLNHHLIMLIAPLIFILEGLILTTLLRKRTRAPKPTIQLSATGITFDLPEYRLGPIFWNEIQSLRVIKVFGTELLRVNLKEPQTTMARALQLKNMPASWIYKRSFRRNRVNISLSDFPLTARQIAEKITVFDPELVKR